MTHVRILAGLFLVALAPLAAPYGCGGEAISAEKLCDKSCGCKPNGCTDAQLETCKEEQEATEKAAEHAGCESRYEPLKECLFDASCKDGDLNQDACTSQTAALLSCQK